MHAPDRGTTPCLVCGFRDVHTDEVVDRPAMLLGWCPRCDHRWTLPDAGLRPAALRALLRARSEAA